METERSSGLVAMSNLAYFSAGGAAGFMLREAILRLRESTSFKLEEVDFLQALHCLFGSTPEALSDAVGYVLYKPEPPLSLDMTIEACVSDVNSAMLAYRGGCNSLELCVDRPQGGVTPGSVFIESVSSRLRSRGVQIQVLVRPRPGSFVYSDEEFDLVQSEIRMAKEAGATGVVAGILQEDGFIHQDRMSVVKNLCTKLGLLLTFHRAFDVAADSPEEALEIVTALGCERLLTSGRRDRVTDGGALQLLESLHRASKGKVQIVAGAGIKPTNVAKIINDSGVRAVHCGSGITSKLIHNYSKGEKEDYSDSSTLQDGLNAAWDQVDRAKAAALVHNACEAWAASPVIGPVAAMANVTPLAQDQGGTNSYLVVDDDYEGVQEHSGSPTPASVENRAPAS